MAAHKDVDAQREQDLRFLLERAGIRAPEDRIGAMTIGYRELSEMATMLRRPRTAASEPATTYSLETITRGE